MFYTPRQSRQLRSTPQTFLEFLNLALGDHTPDPVSAKLFSPMTGAETSAA